MKKLNFQGLLVAFIIVILALVFIFPVAASIGSSFWVDKEISIKNYTELFFDCFIFYPMFWNSILYAAVITLLQLAVIIPCSFGFIHAKFRDKEGLYIFT